MRADLWHTTSLGGASGEVLHVGRFWSVTGFFQCARLALERPGDWAHFERIAGKGVDQAVAIELVVDELPLALARDQAGVFQDGQVARDGWRAHGKALRQVGRGQPRLRQVGEDLTARAGRQRFKNKIEGHERINLLTNLLKG